jgi:hypothetical protein
MTQTGKLQKNKLHLMARFSAHAQFGQCRYVGFALGVEEAL